MVFVERQQAEGAPRVGVLDLAGIVQNKITPTRTPGRSRYIPAFAVPHPHSHEDARNSTWYIKSKKPQVPVLWMRMRANHARYITMA